MTREEFNKIPPKQQIAALNKQFDDMGVLYKNGGIFKSTDMIGVFNVIQKSKSEIAADKAKKDKAAAKKKAKQ